MSTPAQKYLRPTAPVEDPANWLAEDVQRDQSWAIELEAAEVRELESAVEAVLSAGKEPCAFSREDFNLPTLAPKVLDWMDQVENGRGYVLIRGIDPKAYDPRGLNALYWGVAVHCGLPISQNAKGDLIGHVKDQGNDYQSNNVRGYTTSAELRAHCDAADVVGLLCKHPSKSGGESQIASSVSVFNHILVEHPEFVDPLLEGFHFDLRGEGVTDNPDEVTRHRVPIFSWYEGRLSCRYNGKTIIDGMRKAGQPLSGVALDAVKAVGELAMSKPFRYDMVFRQGDIQLLSNHSVLHSRAAFEDYPEPERKRDLLRLWLNVREGRPLVPEFAERLNTGPRGGVHVREAAE